MSDWHGKLARVISERIIACTSEQASVTFSHLGGDRLEAFISRNVIIAIGGPEGTLGIRLTPLRFMPIREYLTGKIQSTFSLTVFKARRIAVGEIPFFAFFGLTQRICGSIFHKPEVA